MANTPLAKVSSLLVGTECNGNRGVGWIR